MSRIDDIFKENMGNHGFGYDDSYWDEMEKMLDRKKRKKTVFYFSLLTSIMMLATIGIFMFLNEGEGIQKPVSVKEKSNLVKSEAMQEEINNESKGESGDKKEETIVLNDRKQENRTKSDDIGKGQVPVKEGKKEQSSVKIDASKINSSGSLMAVANQPTTKLENLNESDILFPDERLAMIGFMPLARPENNPENLFIVYKPENIYKKPNPIAVKPQKDSSKMNAKWQYFIAPGYEYDMYSRTANNAPLKAEEKTVNTNGYNLNFIARKNNWGFKTGCGIIQLSELTNYTIINKNYSFDTTYRMVDTYYKQSSTGSRIALIKRSIDTNITQSSAVNNPDNRVTFTYFKIPLIATYELKFHQLGLFINAGFNTSFLIKKKGEYTTFNGSNYNIENVQEHNDFSKVLFQTYTAVGINLHFSKSFSIYAGYGLSKSLNSMVKSYDQKPKINLFTLGLEIKL